LIGQLGMMIVTWTSCEKDIPLNYV
jgi:hypothetical protein